MKKQEGNITNFGTLLIGGLSQSTTKKELSQLRPFNSKHSYNKCETRVFLGNLPYDITEETLSRFFSKYGEIVDVVIPRDKTTTQNKGYGFIAFADEQITEKCLADQFVFLGGRLIQIKKAEPRNLRYKSSDSLSWSSISETNVFEALEEEDEDEKEVQSDVSGNEYLAIQQNSALKTLLENYFSEKLTSFDKMNEKQLENENETICPRDSKVTEIEKFLTDVLSISYESGASVSDLINFSGQSEGETESDEDVACFFPSNLSKPPVLNGKETSSNQKPMPLQIRNSEGFLMCSVCQWISPNDSMESFLAHCKTSLHKTKLKNRFPTEPAEEQLKIDLKAKSGSDKPPKKKRKKKVKIIEKDVKESQPSGAAAIADKKNKVQTNAVNKKNVKPEAEVNTNLKIHALAKGMASIQPFSKDELMCKLCKKKIPKASEFDILMKNVSSHLLSKIHLKKLSETENSMMGTCKATPPLNSKEKENQKQNCPKAQEKKNKCHEGNDKNKASAVGKPKNDSKVTNNRSKKKQVNTPNSDIKFLCLPCNVCCDSIDVFNVHVKLKSHSDNLSSKNVKAEVSMANMGKCKGCNFYLCGSLYQINKHYSKCVGK